VAGKRKITRNKDTKIDNIVNTFFQLVNNRGYEKVSTNHVAEAAGVSIGTVYRYFPEGKPSIIRELFEKNKNEIFNQEDFVLTGEETLPGVIRTLVTNHLRVHRKNFEIHRAYQLAILVNKEVFEDYETTIREANLEIVKKLREENEFFNTIPEDRLVKKFILIYNIIEAFVMRHLYTVPVFVNDESLVEFLIKIIIFTIQEVDLN
jgi:AcrR family transcriptional regulator